MKGKSSFSMQQICVPALPSQIEKKRNKILKKKKKKKKAALPILQELQPVAHQASDAYVQANHTLQKCVNSLQKHLDAHEEARSRRDLAGQPHPLADCYIDELKMQLKDARKLLERGERLYNVPQL